MPYTLDEIISSISSKPLQTGLADAASDVVSPEEFLRSLHGNVDLRTGLTRVPVASLRILQGALEMWRYLRLCTLSPRQFQQLMEKQPLDVVRGRMIGGYPLLLGNHRALYALMHGITELPATVHFIADEEISLRFEASFQQQYRHLDRIYGRHDAAALREAYKSALANLPDIKEYSRHKQPGDRHIDFDAARYRRIEKADLDSSAMIPCISLKGYLQTLENLFGINSRTIIFSEESAPYDYLVLTQSSIEHAKLTRIAQNPYLLDAPILVLRTRLIDYVVVGHTRLRARLDESLPPAAAIVLQGENDRFHAFLDNQAVRAGYLAGKEGIRRLTLI